MKGKGGCSSGSRRTPAGGAGLGSWAGGRAASAAALPRPSPLRSPPARGGSGAGSGAGPGPFALAGRPAGSGSALGPPRQRRELLSRPEDKVKDEGSMSSCLSGGRRPSTRALLASRVSGVLD